MVASARRSIGHLRASNFVGGPEKQILGHLARLDRSRFRGVLISFEEGGRQNELLGRANKEGLETVAVSQKKGAGFGLLGQIKRILEEQRIDLLCTHDYKSAILGSLAGRLAGTKVVAFYRGRTRENAKIQILQSVEDRLHWLLAGRVAVSAAELARLTSRPREGRDFVVHNAVILEGSPATPAQREETWGNLGIKQHHGPLILVAGRLSPEKGTDILIRAMTAVVDAHPSCRVVVCGEGQMRRDLEVLAVERGVEHAVHFAGFRRDLAAIMGLIDLLVLPSRSEGFPNVVLEAMAAGKPVVAADVGGVGEAIENGKTGVLVAPDSPDALASGIIEALASPERMAEMAAAGHVHALESFSFDAQNRHLEDIYDQILEGGDQQRRARQEGHAGWLRANTTLTL